MHKVISAGLLLIWGNLLFAENGASAGLINVSRLSIARVSASSYNGQHPPFEIRYAFDGDIPLKNGNYPVWIAKAHKKEDINEWVNIRFIEPITTHKIAITSEDSSVSDVSYVVTFLGKAGEEAHQEIGPFSFKDNYVETSLLQPLKDVKNIRVNLVAAKYSPVKIREIQILGLVPGVKDLSLVTPRVDGPIPEKYWDNLAALSYYDPPQSLPKRRFVVAEKEAVIINDKNAIVKTFGLTEIKEEKQLKGNHYAVKQIMRYAKKDKDEQYLLIKRHEWTWEEDRDSDFHQNIGEYVEAGDPGKVWVEVYDLQGRKVLEKNIVAPVEYEDYCVKTSTAEIDVTKC